MITNVDSSRPDLSRALQVAGSGSYDFFSQFNQAACCGWIKYILHFETNTFTNLRQIHLVT